MMKRAKKFTHAVGRLLCLVFMTLGLSVSAQASSKIQIDKGEIIIDAREGMPFMKAKINGEVYKFLITPSDHLITISPEIVAKLKLKPSASYQGVGVNIDYENFTTKATRLEIDFEDIGPKKYRADWLFNPFYEGYDGSVNPFLLGNKKVTFLLNDHPADQKMEVEKYKSVGDNSWRFLKRNFIDGVDFQIAFRPHYDTTRMTIGAAYVIESSQKIEQADNYFMPREFRGYKDFILAKLSKPIYPLSSNLSLKEAEFHILTDSRETVVTAEDEVVVKGKSKRKYSHAIWLGLDHFKGCNKIEFALKAKLMRTYCLAVE